MTEIDKQIQADYKNRINRVFEFIDQNLESDLSLNRISEIAFFSPFHFHRVFFSYFNVTISDYIRKRKFTLAAVDIVSSKVNIDDVA